MLKNFQKWWGWGDESKSFSFAGKPDLLPWIVHKLALHGIVANSFDPETQPSLPPSRISLDEFLDLQRLVSPERISTETLTRARHSYGKSYPDIWRARRGQFARPPDAVVFPTDNFEVQALVAWAKKNQWTVVPFGGGTNIVGGVENRDPGERKCLCLNLRGMNRMLAFDAVSNTARFEGGILGPEIEAALAKNGFTLGHFPDSFEFSSLGGWVATRSAGMQSDGYGKIEDLVVSLKLVTPTGIVETATVPTSSAGPNLNHLVIGSEGTFGVITEITVRVHRLAATQKYVAALLPSFVAGIELSRELRDLKDRPALCRIQDQYETELAFKTKSPPKGFRRWIHRAIKKYLQWRGFQNACLAICLIKGTTAEVTHGTKILNRLLKKHQAFRLGSSVGAAWSKDKFSAPYLRDSLMDFGVLVDVAETATTWDKLPTLYNQTILRMNQKFIEKGRSGYIGCHLSHSYSTGACLYFTYACLEKPELGLGDYYDFKHFITELFVGMGATLSHHHAVGYEHKPWLVRELGSSGIRALQALKLELDPDLLLNPGKLMSPAPHPFMETAASVSEGEASL